MTDDGADLIGRTFHFDAGGGGQVLIYSRTTKRNAPALVCQWSNLTKPEPVSVTSVRKWVKDREWYA